MIKKIEEFIESNRVTLPEYQGGLDEAVGYIDWLLEDRKGKVLVGVEMAERLRDDLVLIHSLPSIGVAHWEITAQDAGQAQADAEELHRLIGEAEGE